MLALEEKEDRLKRVSKILKSMSTRRLKILIYLSHGVKNVGEITTWIYGSNTHDQLTCISRYLLPMRQLGLVAFNQRGRYYDYEITELGWEVVTFVEKLDTKIGNGRSDGIHEDGI